MIRKIRGDRHLRHLPRGVMMDVDESLDTYLNKNHTMMKIRRIKGGMNGPRKGLQDGA